MRIAVAFLLVSSACVSEGGVGGDEAAVVYGIDDRTEVYAHPDPALRALARNAIVALVRPGELDESDPRNVRPIGDTLREARDLCESERFLDQPTIANCSGTLVGHDLIVTAGHCVDDLRDCQRYRYVFDFFYESADTLATIDADTDVYQCRELVARVEDGSTDYAFVRLDRPVTGRIPASVRTMPGPVALDTPLTVIGFGSGLPAKIDDGGKVLDARASRLDYFEGNLDTFGGNSGSGVFIGTDWAGILVRGEGDYEAEGDCSVVRVLPEEPAEGDDEDCTYGTTAIAGLCATDFVSDLCGDTEGWCRACGADADCPDDWACLAAGDEGSRFCAAPCGAEPCRTGHVCIEGWCQPESTPSCVGSAITERRCGRVTGTLEECAEGLLCAGGECLPPEPGDSCDAPFEVEPVSQTLTGHLGPLHSNNRRSRCGGAGPDAMVRFEILETTDFVAESAGVGADFDTVLYLREQCDNPRSEVACDDDEGPDHGSRLELRLTPGVYTLILDAFEEDADDDYTLDLEFTPVREEAPDAGFDAGPADAGPADVGFDALLGDAGADAGTMEPGGGCGCRVGSGGSGGGFVALFAMLATIRRRRRR